MGDVLEKLKLPLGSIVVDIGLVIYVTFMAGQMVERLEALDRRMTAVENRAITPEAQARLAAAETRLSAHERDMAMLREDIRARLDRIERLLDGHQTQDRARP